MIYQVQIAKHVLIFVQLALMELYAKHAMRLNLELFQRQIQSVFAWIDTITMEFKLVYPVTIVASRAAGLLQLV
jgi:hypothetical protein